MSSSTIVIIYIWKPYFLFSKGLKLSVGIYWWEFSKYILVVGFSFYFSALVLDCIPIRLAIYTSWFDWILYAIIIAVVSTIIVCFSLLVATQGTRNLLYRLIKR